MANFPISVEMQEPAGTKDRLVVVFPTLKVCKHSPLLASHSLTVLSHDADASRVELCEKATESIPRLCPSRVCKHALQLLLIAGFTMMFFGSSCRNNLLIALSVQLNNNAEKYVWKG
jgi:hypothetical protein